MSSLGVRRLCKAANLFSIIGPRLLSFNDVRSLIFDIFSKEDRLVLGRVAMMILGFMK